MYVPPNPFKVQDYFFFQFSLNDPILIVKYSIMAIKHWIREFSLAFNTPLMENGTFNSDGCNVLF